MDSREIKELITKADAITCAEALTDLFVPHTAPVFGAAKVVEHEVAAFRALQRLGYLPAQPDEYDLVMLLRVTKAKARSLLYQVALRRRLSSEEIDAALRELLTQPRVSKEGDKVMIEVADPLLMDCLRQRVRQLSFISDGSFSGSLAKLSVPALSALIEDLIPKKQRSAIHKKLSAQGVRGDDFQGIIAAVLGQLGKRAAGTAGERVAEQIGEKIADFFVDAASAGFNWVIKSEA